MVTGDDGEVQRGLRRPLISGVRRANVEREDRVARRSQSRRDGHGTTLRLLRASGRRTASGSSWSPARARRAARGRRGPPPEGRPRPSGRSVGPGAVEGRPPHRAEVARVRRASVPQAGGPAAAPGTIYLVGGGPGDPSALTLRAATVLASCDVVPTTTSRRVRRSMSCLRTSSSTGRSGARAHRRRRSASARRVSAAQAEVHAGTQGETEEVPDGQLHDPDPEEGDRVGQEGGDERPELR
jgi:hypothetical protein